MVCSRRADLGGVGTNRVMHGPRNSRPRRRAATRAWMELAITYDVSGKDLTLKPLSLLPYE
jgi:hypothetical protein